MPNPNQNQGNPQTRSVLNSLVSNPEPEFIDPLSAPPDVPLTQDPVTGKFMKATATPKSKEHRGFAAVGDATNCPKSRDIVTLDIYEYPVRLPGLKEHGDG